MDLLEFHPSLPIFIGQSEDVDLTDTVGPLPYERWQAGKSPELEIYSAKPALGNANVKKVIYYKGFI